MIDVRDTDLGDYQRAARTLLAHGIVTAEATNERTWRNVKRFADALDANLQELAGYRVIVTRHAVRLVRHLERHADGPVLRTPSGAPFDRTRYALVALTLAALERLGAQITLSDLALHVRRSAEGTPGLAFAPDEHVSRLALGHALRALEALGAVRLTDGSREAWEQGANDAEALYDIDRALCRELFPLQRVLGAGETTSLLAAQTSEGGRDALARARRQRLARRLLEQPVVYLFDLDDADQHYLRHEARRLAEQLEHLTGAPVERVREGLALIDPGQRFTDHAFPSGGADQQAALLLAARLCDARAELPLADGPHGDERSDELDAALVVALGATAAPLPPMRARTQHPFASDTALLSEARALVERLGEVLKADHRDHPERFLADGLAVLRAHDLVRAIPGGVVLLPALARFREPTPQGDPELLKQIDLFGATS